MSDLISREYMKSLGATCIASRSKDGTLFPIVAIDELPPAEQPKERCIATISLSEEDLERIVKERVEEIKERLPRKGKWIYGESEIGNDGYYCSVCGNFVPWKYDEYDIDFIKEFLFCPCCGADMRPQFEEPEINPCRGCEDYDGKGGCKTKGGCAGLRGDSE